MIRFLLEEEEKKDRSVSSVVPFEEEEAHSRRTGVFRTAKKRRKAKKPCGIQRSTIRNKKRSRVVSSVVPSAARSNQIESNRM